MGADGGLCWITVTGDEKRFRDLTRPLGFLEWDDYMDEQHYAWIERHGDPSKKPGVVMSTYGTPQDTQGLSDLITVVRGLLDSDGSPVEPAYLDSYKDVFIEMTFEDLALSILTRPAYWNCGYTSYAWDGVLETIVKERFLPWRYFENSERDMHLRNTEEPILGMNLLEWAKEVMSLIDLASYNEVQTWT